MNEPIGRILFGDPSDIQLGVKRFLDQPIDETHFHEGPYPYSLKRTTLANPAFASGPGTFDGRHVRTLGFAPSERSGWWIRRTDLPEQFPIAVCPRNVRSAARNIVLRAGADANQLRMVEHIIALRLGLGIDNLELQVSSDDPPLFDRSSLDLVEAFQNAGTRELDEPARFITVREPVTVGSGRHDFLTFLPAEPGQRTLRLDVAVDFASAIGKQRIQFDVTPETFGIGAGARTNAPYSLYLYVKTLGRFSSATAHYGYTKQNILIHGKKAYLNEPRMEREAVWHRATLDLLAAIALLDGGRFCGTILSYRAGHVQDCRAVAALERENLLVEAS